MRTGIVSSLEEPNDRNGNRTAARVAPQSGATMLTRPLTIPAWLRGSLGNLAVGTPVIFDTFADGTGLILSRADGDWFPENL